MPAKVNPDLTKHGHIVDTPALPDVHRTSRRAGGMNLGPNRGYVTSVLLSLGKKRWIVKASSATDWNPPGQNPPSSLPLRRAPRFFSLPAVSFLAGGSTLFQPPISSSSSSRSSSQATRAECGVSCCKINDRPRNWGWLPLIRVTRRCTITPCESNDSRSVVVDGDHYLAEKEEPRHGTPKGAFLFVFTFVVRFVLSLLRSESSGRTEGKPRGARRVPDILVFLYRQRH